MSNKRLLRAATLAVALHLPLPLASSAPDAPPAAATAACAVDKETYSKLPPNTVLQVQNALAYFGLYDNRFDAIFGKDTRNGLAQYCALHGLSIGADAASRQAILDELVRDSTIDRVYRGWRGILASAGFAPWTELQKDKDAIRVQVKTGTAAQIIDIIDRYLKYRPDSAKRHPSWPDGHGISYSLFNDDYATLAARRGVLDKLGKLKGGSFMEQADFTAAVGALLGGGAEAKAALELVEEYADKRSTVTLGPQGIAHLRAAGVPDEVLERLGELEDPGYTSRDMAGKAVRSLLAEGGQASVMVALANAVATGKEASADDAKWAPLIVSQLDESIDYRISEEAWAKIAKAAGAVPAYVPALLQGIRDVDYPMRGLFLAAVHARIKSHLDTYGTLAGKEIAQRDLRQLDDAFFARLKEGQLPDELAALLRPLKEKPFESGNLLAGEVAKIFRDETERIPEYRDLLADQARKLHPLDPSKAILLSPTTDCKCLPNDMKHMVYSFYPFWLAGQARSVDFSGVSRIGYYGLGVNDDGKLQLPSANVAGYFGQASATIKKYGTAVDYVVAKRDWSAWAVLPPEKRIAAFDTLAAGIAELLRAELADPLSRLKPYITPGTSDIALADGVTLFFEHYPEEKEYADEFYQFLRKLRTALAGSKKFVNIMVPRDALGAGAFGYERLKPLLHNDKGAADAPERLRLLVTLGEPYSDARKALRRDIEERLHGADRRNFLRTIVPVIVPDGKSKLADDVIYMGDNFGGIGFWPSPLEPTAAPGAALLPDNSSIKQEYAPKSNKTGHVCDIVCPNRWLFHLALNTFLIASLGCLAAFIGCCECRPRLRRHFIPILACTVVPLIVLFMALLACDPSWSKLAEGNQPLYLVLLAIVVYAIWEYWQRKQEIP